MEVPPKELSFLAPLKGFDFSSEQAETLGAEKSKDSFILKFFQREIEISREHIAARDNTPVTDAVAETLVQYLINCPGQMPAPCRRLVTFREFSGASPLFSRFTANTAKTIQTQFSGDLSGLLDRCQRLGGRLLETQGQDLSLRFTALARIPIILNFNDIDEIMPASAGFLYEDRADHFLDLKGLMTTCTYLTGMLIQ